ncbi:hypothetical protein F4778DRAFT_52037 [Xylariomycetidae sp. FL2044]|nr:hypothetical protein F4778DRAFT_52037 [Xylariomycetidae sp. FL2044]
MQRFNVSLILPSAVLSHRLGKDQLRLLSHSTGSTVTRERVYRCASHQFLTRPSLNLDSMHSGLRTFALPMCGWDDAVLLAEAC